MRGNYWLEVVIVVVLETVRLSQFCKYRRRIDVLVYHIIRHGATV
jgi:hypothetical protein